MSSRTAFIVMAVVLLGFFALRFLGKIAPEKARALLADGALLLDVRSPEEFASGHIDGAKNVPVGDLSKRLGELDAAKQRPVIVYCASGVRSAFAKRTLLANGFSQVHDLGAMSRY